MKIFKDNKFKLQESIDLIISFFNSVEKENTDKVFESDEKFQRKSETS